MSEPAADDAPPLISFVYAVRMVVSIAGTAVPVVMGYCDTKEDGNAAARELTAELQSIANHPTGKALFERLMVSNIGVNVAPIPRLSTLALPKDPGRIVVAKA